jgi:HlyD family secretion protein
LVVLSNPDQATHADINKSSGSTDPKGTVSGEVAKPSRHLTLLLSIAVVVAVILFFARNLILGTPVAGYAVMMGPLQQTVVASGRVVWPQRIDIAAESIGRVLEIPVLEGQQVVQGQLLIQLEDHAERANLVLATAAVAQAAATIRQQQEVALPAAEEGLVQALADANQIRQQLLRIRQLRTQDYVTTADLDTAIRNLAVAESKVHSAERQVTTNQTAGSAATLAQTTLAQAQASLQLAQVKLQQAAIHTPAAGTLIRRSVEPGDIVQPGKILMVLAAQGETQLLVQIDEKNLAKLAIGQQALGSADAYSAQRFDAEIIYINPGVDAARGSVEIRLRVAQPPDYLRQDMTVSVDIETAHSANALVIPTAALRDPSGVQPWVLVVRDRRTLHQPVTVGLRGDNYLEVLTGVSAGEAVILPIEGLITADQRVRVRLAAPMAAMAADGSDL